MGRIDGSRPSLSRVGPSTTCRSPRADSAPPPAHAERLQADRRQALELLQRLRDDGLSYQDYLEQLTYLLFLKMADERAGWDDRRIVPEDFDWPSLLARDGDELEVHYRHVLEELVTAACWA